MTYFADCWLTTLVRPLQVTAITGLSVTTNRKEAEHRTKWKNIVDKATKTVQGHNLQQ